MDEPLNPAGRPPFCRQPGAQERPQEEWGRGRGRGRGEAAGRAPASGAGPLRPASREQRPGLSTGLSHFSSSARALPARPGPAPSHPGLPAAPRGPPLAPGGLRSARARWARASPGPCRRLAPPGASRGLAAGTPDSGPPTLGLSFHIHKPGRSLSGGRVSGRLPKAKRTPSLGLFPSEVRLAVTPDPLCLSQAPTPALHCSSRTALSLRRAPAGDARAPQPAHPRQLSA